MNIFKIQDGGRPPFWKSLNRHISVHYSKCWTRLQSRDQKRKLCVRKQNGMPTKATWHKLQIFKIHDGGRPVFWKSLYRHISVKNLPILMKFGIQHQILNPITVMWPKIEIFKTWDGDGRHLKNRFFGHNSLIDCPISAKFCTRKQNSMPTKAAWQKLQIFKIQDGGRPPFWKSLNHHISVELLLDFDKIWCTAALTEPDEVFKSAIAVS